jgi:hypothetical protein
VHWFPTSNNSESFALGCNPALLSARLGMRQGELRSYGMKLIIRT